MKKIKALMPEAYDFNGKLPLKQAIPLGLQHVMAMFVGNLTPLLIITGACGIGAGSEYASIQVALLQNAMIIAGIVTLIQLFSIGPVGGKVPIIMGTSSGFIGVFSSVTKIMGGGILAYGAIMGASIIGGLFETVLGAFIKPLRKFFPSVVTGTVVLSIGLSLISVGINSFGGGSSAKDFGSLENLFLAFVVLVVILFVKHWTQGILFLPSDQPLITRTSLQLLCLTFLYYDDKICRLSYNENAGSPCIFPAKYYDELLNLPEKKGGGFLTKKYPAQVVLVPVRDEYELYDIDTPDDITRLLKFLH
jgi:hypothetical protein